MPLATNAELVGCGFGDVYLSWHPIRFHAGRRVHSVTKQLKARLLTPKYARDDVTGIQTHTHLQIGRVISQDVSQVPSQIDHFTYDISCKFHHNDGMVLLGIRKTSLQ
jgi:hypothetical protein